MGEVSYEAARQRVVQRLRKRAFFGLHLLFFIAVCAYFNAWSSASGLTYYSYQGYQIILFLWFGVISVHFIYAFEVWQRIVDHTVQRELGKSGVTEIKRKNVQVALGEDGELVPLDELVESETASAYSERSKRNHGSSL